MKTKRTSTMKSNQRFLRAFCAIALSTAILLAFAPAGRANLTYEVYMNVAPLTTGANGPYSLDFQLAQGADNQNNTVTISNFNITGGSFSGTSFVSAGGASGSVASSVVLSSTAGVANDDIEFAEYFTIPTTKITFQVNETNNQETGGTSPAADQFNIAVLENDADLDPIETSDPFDALFIDPMTGSQNQNQFQEYTSNGEDGNPAGVTAVPEPGSMAMFSIGGLVLAIWIRRKTSRICA